MKSAYLDTIFAKHNRIASSNVVFVDVNGYSKRRTKTQTEVIDAFMASLAAALKAVGKIYLDFAQANNINFATDIIKIPTGDGAAIVFPFEGVHDIHLAFAKELLQAIQLHNQKQHCDRFDQDGWCNCHNNFTLSIGISEGKTVLFRDVNDNYNTAGNPLNMAARVMALADPQQILFTDEAYHQLIDMVDDPYLVDAFREFKNVRVKHNLRLTVHQYVNPELPYLNSKPPKDVEFGVKFEELRKSFGGGFPLPQENETGKEEVLQVMEKMGQAMAIINGIKGMPLGNASKNITPAKLDSEPSKND